MGLELGFKGQEHRWAFKTLKKKKKFNMSAMGKLEGHNKPG